MARFEIEANGKRYEVEAPDIQTALKALGGRNTPTAAPAQAAPPEKPRPDMLSAGLTGAADMLSFGFDDEIGAGAKTGFGLWGDYNKELEAQRGTKTAAQEAHPVAYTAGQVAGAIPTAFVPGVGIAKGVGMGAKIARGVAGGAAQGGAYGFGSGEGGLENRAIEAAKGAVAGGAIGGVAPVAGKVIGNAVGAKAGRAAAPTVAQLKTKSQALYKAADQQGLLVDPKSFDGAINRITFDLQAKGLDATLHPKATAALKRLSESKGVANTLQDIETLRRVAGQAALSTEPAERHMAARIIDGLDDFMDGLKPADVIAGNATDAVRFVKGARSLWQAKSKGELLADLYQRAELSPSGLENGLRIEFRNLAKNPKKLRRFSQTEQKEIRRIANGGSLQTLLRTVGKAAPTGIVSGGLSSGAGFATAGPIGAAAVPAAGWAARKAATAIKKGQFNKLDATVRSGGSKPFDQRAALIAQLQAAGLISGAGRGGLLPPFVGSPLEITVTKPGNMPAR